MGWKGEKVRMSQASAHHDVTNEEEFEVGAANNEYIDIIAFGDVQWAINQGNAATIKLEDLDCNALQYLCQ